MAELNIINKIIGIMPLNKHTRDITIMKHNYIRQKINCMPDDITPENIKLFNINNIDQETDIIKLSCENSNAGLKEFNCKKILESILTDAVNQKYIFKKNADRSFKLQKLVLHTFNNMIDIYKNEKKIPENNIYFIYKGGSYLRIIYDEYKNEVDSNSNFKFLSEFLRGHSKWFKKGDSDYSLLINPNLQNFNEIYCELNILSSFCLLYIREELYKNYHIYFGVDKAQFGLSSENLSSIMNNMNNMLSNINKNPECGKYSDIAKFRSIQYFDEIYDDNYVTDDFEDQKAIVDYDKIQHKFHGRFDFIVFKNNNDSYYRQILKNKNVIYLSINDTNDYDKSHFCLQRLKINFNLTFDEIQKKESSKFTKTNENLNINLAAELIDVSIPKKNDYDLNLIFSDPSVFIEKKKFECDVAVEKIDSITVNSYSLYGFFIDLSIMMFAQHTPWTIVKKDKRIMRYVVLLMLINYRHNKNSIENFNEFYELFKNISIQKINIIGDQINTSEIRNILLQIENFIKIKIKDEILLRMIKKFIDIYISYINRIDISNYNNYNNVIKDFEAAFNINILPAVEWDIIEESYLLNDDQFNYCDMPVLFGGKKNEYIYKYIKYNNKIKNIY
jgi:hypothetical protein